MSDSMDEALAAIASLQAEWREQGMSPGEYAGSSKTAQVRFEEWLEHELDGRTT